jgi:hypothetical protein
MDNLNINSSNSKTTIPADQNQKNASKKNVKEQNESLISNIRKQEEKISDLSPPPQPKNQSEYVESSLQIKQKEHIQNVNILSKEESQKRRQEYDNMLQKLFMEAPPARGTEKIVITGTVLSDGMGDYFHMRAIANELHKHYPNRDVKMLIVGHMPHKDKLPLAKKEGVLTHIIYPSSTFPHVLLAEFKKIGLDPHKIVKDASLIIHGPVGIEGLYKEVEQEMGEKGIAIFEYDNSEGGYYRYCKTHLPMGLSTENLGIITKPIKNYTWDMIINPCLQEVLFGDDKDLDPNNKNIYLSYLPKEKNTCQFIDQCIAFAGNDEKNIDIITPRKEQISLEILNNNIDTTSWIGVATIRILSYDAEGKKSEEVQKLSDSGKEVRIVNTGHVPPKDFKILTSLSNPLMACTGDKSVDRALSEGKIPYYDAPSHKALFRGSIMSEMKRILSVKSPLYQYFFYCTRKYEVAKKILAENHDQLIEDARTFSQTIVKERSFNHTLFGAANQKIYFHENPQIKTLVDDLSKEYEMGNIPLDEAKKEIQDAINFIESSNE